MKQPVVLLILDGWGNREKKENNSVLLGETPNYCSILKNYPSTELNASGTFVGLPDGQMGNSEVGHLNIGSGRIVYQDLTRIDNAIETGAFFDNRVLKKAISNAVLNKKAIHFAGLLSDGGVHSQLSHLIALLKMSNKLGAEEVYVHAILDGRDVPPSSAMVYIKKIEAVFKTMGIGSLASIAGRYYTMDRDNRFERLEKGYAIMALGKGLKANSAEEALQMAYERGETDEFVLPTVILHEGKPVVIEDEDTVVFFNYRSDRAREISRVFLDPSFKGFETKHIKVNYICMTEYDSTLKGPIAFPPEHLQNTLGEYISKRGLKQLRAAETEKYAHVTFFFNDGIEAPNKGEHRILIPSPKVATYDLQPEMSLPQLTDSVLEALDKDIYDVVIVNFANGDMVGHTGILEAAIKAVEAVDKALGKVAEKVLEKNGQLLITADHGNCETMADEKSGEPLTSHTLNPVPFILVSKAGKSVQLKQNQNLALRDIVPTILSLLGLEIPEEMTGKSLIIK
ncbi:2,3-bisphosphoglycerate-independent phosphoglycerate mutase [endosymbiont 'TC1' of Trimyema compressum]|uniref:2,3-bisphosphoglycerate-independent phosphoglycerate mutase n=1 Tax=endosymbiont 'TC1' of Trimyema compressum TaxID=243899 RepID=UPI0007F086FA|nr:2,3-bisphosphoglycerate-independent phosphoglycerate mutase [endosymbiont 'TC1' of Trimyema compressum]AMP20421.1 2,3-bisphosphoglycerate-independent phosphoglycerate mutase [endosymbiont 'TC1' of Trimyema compressum]